MLRKQKKNKSLACPQPSRQSSPELHCPLQEPGAAVRRLEHVRRALDLSLVPTKELNFSFDFILNNLPADVFYAVLEKS